MRSLQVALGARSYPIHLGRDLDPALLADALAGRPAVALVDAQVAAVQGPRLDALLGGRPRLTDFGLVTSDGVGQSVAGVAHMPVAGLHMSSVHAFRSSHTTGCV